MNATQKAAAELREALNRLNRAKSLLRQAKNDQHIPLTAEYFKLMGIYDLLTDPECTPEIAEGGENP